MSLSEDQTISDKQKQCEYKIIGERNKKTYADSSQNRSSRREHQICCRKALSAVSSKNAKHDMVKSIKPVKFFPASSQTKVSE